MGFQYGNTKSSFKIWESSRTARNNNSHFKESNFNNNSQLPENNNNNEQAVEGE